MRFLVLFATLCLFGQFSTQAAEPTIAGPPTTAGGGLQIVWEVKNRFRLFRDDTDFLRQAEALRGGTILAAERQLARQSSGLGWAKDVVTRLCLDKFGNLLETCERDGERENYLAPRDHPISVALSGPVPHTAACDWTFDDGAKPTRRINAPCERPVTLRVRYGRTTTAAVTVKIGDNTIQRLAQDVAVRDVLVVGLGDSVAAGEGDPDRALALEGGFCFKRFLVGSFSQYYRPGRAGYGGDRSCENQPPSASDTLDWARHGARWMSPACHRSLYSYQVRATLALAAEQPHIAVTLIPLACTGAHIEAGLFSGQLIDDCPWVVGVDLCNNTGPAQLAELSAVMAAVHRAEPERKLDLILLTIGANDVDFAALLTDVIVADKTERQLLQVGGAIVSPEQAQKKLTQQFPSDFARLRVALKRFVGGSLRHVVFVSYPNPAMQAEDEPCDGGPDGLDVNPGFSADRERLRAAATFVDARFLPQLKALATCGPPNACRDAATDRMTFVDAHQPAFARHGMCAHARDDPEFDRLCFSRAGKSFVADSVTAMDNPMSCSRPAGDYRPYASRARWIRTVNDSYFTAMTYPEGMPAMLRPSDVHDALWSVLSAVYGGAAHPTAEGYAAMADATLPAIRDVLGLTVPALDLTKAMPAPPEPRTP
jgi:hypothetical protein